MEKRLEALEGIEAPDSIRAVRFRQSKALELHSKFPISADDFSLSFGNCMLYDHAKFEIRSVPKWPSPVATVQERPAC